MPLTLVLPALAEAAFRPFPVNRNVLILSTSSDPKSFNPIIAKETSTTLVTGFLFEGLTQTDGVTLEVKPALAESWNHSPDGKTWIFQLRQGVYWHDGSPFTADDVVFTFNQLIFNQDIPTSSRDIFLINGKPLYVEKIDSRRVKFVLPDSFAPFLRLLGQEILPRHLLEKTVHSQKFNSAWGVHEKTEKIVGTGPFRLREYRPGEWIILEKNPRYWKRGDWGKRLPYLDRIVILIIADPNMALLKFKAGEIDVLSVRGQDYPLLKPFENKGNFTIYQVGPSLGEEFLVFNQNQSSPLPQEKKLWFSNLLFRRAVAHAIDKQSIIRNVLGGFGYPQNGPLNISSGYFYNPKIICYEYNLTTARKLLENSRFYWKENRLYDSSGNPVEFTIMTNSNNPERVQIANIIQDDLKKLGFKVNLLPVEFNTLVTKLTATKDWEAVLIGLTGGIEPHGGKNVWSSGGQLHVWNQGPGNTLTPWEKEIDFLFEAGARELNREKRKRLYDRWQLIVTEQVPMIYTVNSTVMYAIRNRFINLKPTVYGGVFHNIEEISVRQGE
ncbi:MAG: ABC transporter substrate-binding protein [Candidatus Omnitrophica bacterium]|nr:ABC transporter substrate-binding protein [Candidatus Omnitrophota bacterium]